MQGVVTSWLVVEFERSQSAKKKNKKKKKKGG